MISDNSELLKKTGFALTITLVKLFKFTIEKVADDDDAPANRLSAYLNNPLLLEQFEAQIFSIIRQNLVTS